MPNGGFGDNKPFLAADENLLGQSVSCRQPLRGLVPVGQSTAGELGCVLSRWKPSGRTWSVPLQLSSFAGGEGLAWPADPAVAPNGDVYVAYHSQPDINDNEWEGRAAAAQNPNGTSGQVFVLRSTEAGGVTFPQKTLAFTPGEADITFNRQPAGNIPGTQFWTVGSASRG